MRVEQFGGRIADSRESLVGRRPSNTLGPELLSDGYGPTYNARGPRPVRRLGANWFRSGKLKCLWRVVVDRLATSEHCCFPLR